MDIVKLKSMDFAPWGTGRLTFYKIDIFHKNRAAHAVQL